MRAAFLQRCFGCALACTLHNNSAFPCMWHTHSLPSAHLRRLGGDLLKLRRVGQWELDQRALGIPSVCRAKPVALVLHPLAWSVMKELRMAMDLEEMPVSGCTCLERQYRFDISAL